MNKTVKNALLYILHKQTELKAKLCVLLSASERALAKIVDIIVFVNQ